MENRFNRVVLKASDSIANAIASAVLTGFWGFCIVGAIARVLWLLVAALGSLFY
jgi:hypothetical protein